MAGDELTVLYVNVVPSFAGVGAEAQKGGREAATAFTQGFKADFSPFKAIETAPEAIKSFTETGTKSSEAFAKGFDSLPDQVKKVSEKAAEEFGRGFKESTGRDLPKELGEDFAAGVAEGMMDEFQRADVGADAGREFSEGFERKIKAEVPDAASDVLRKAGDEGGEIGGKSAGDQFADAFEDIVFDKLDHVTGRFGGLGDVMGREGGRRGGRAFGDVFGEQMDDVFRGMTNDLTREIDGWPGLVAQGVGDVGAEVAGEMAGAGLSKVLESEFVKGLGLAGLVRGAAGWALPITLTVGGFFAADWLSDWLVKNDPLKDYRPGGLNTPPFLPNMPTTPSGAPVPGSTPASPIPRPKLTAEQEARLRVMGIDPATAKVEDIYRALGMPVPAPPVPSRLGSGFDAGSGAPTQPTGPTPVVPHARRAEGHPERPDLTPPQSTGALARRSGSGQRLCGSVPGRAAPSAAGCWTRTTGPSPSTSATC